MLERIRNGRTDLVHDWLVAGNPATATADDGVPLIRWCAYYGDVSAIRLLLANGEALSSLGENLDLNGASFHGHWRLCEFLIEQGADPDWRHDDAGETPLHAALSKVNPVAQERVVAVLLAAGANPHAITNPGVETGCFMRDVRTRGETPLHRAAAFGSEAVVDALLDAGAARDAKDAHGDTPLSWASWHQRPSAIIRLLCHDGFKISPNASWTGDHGAGPGSMEAHLAGRPVSSGRSDVECG